MMMESLIDHTLLKMPMVNCEQARWSIASLEDYDSVRKGGE